MKLVEIIPYIDSIKRPADRRAASQRIAKKFGAEELIIFIEDPLLKIFLPAQGYPQTLPSGKDWRAYLENVRKNENVFCELKSPFSGAYTSVRGFNISEDAVLIFLGASPKIALSAEIKVLFSLVVSALQAETAIIHTQGQAQTLRESAEMYRLLAESLELTKQELHQSLESQRHSYMERKRLNEVDAKLLQGTQTLLSTLNYESTLKNIVDTAVDHLADWCVLHLKTDRLQNVFKPAAFAARTPEVQTAITEYFEKYPEVGPGPTPVGRVIQTQMAQSFEGLSQERLQALTKDNNQSLQFWKCLAKALLAQPMHQGSELIGVMVYGFNDERGEFSTQDLLLAERWTAQSTLAIANARLLLEAKEAVHARDELMSLSSHEIRTPITAMKLHIQIARRQIEKYGPGSFTEDRLVQLVEQSDRQLTNLVRLVDDMLDISRINSGEFTVKLERLNLSETVLETIERLMPYLSECGCMVKAHVENDIFVNGDAARLKQVLTNLLTNAGRYGRHKPVVVSLTLVNDKAVLKVCDEGVGIRKEDLQRIFKKFERAVSRNEVSGLGLGLFIVKQILHAHSGSVYAESSPGKGSVFTVELPGFFTSLSKA